MSCPVCSLWHRCEDYLTTFSVTCLIFTLVVTYFVRSEFVNRRMMIGFTIIYTPYLVLMATMGLYGHARQVTRYAKWNPTVRT